MATLIQITIGGVLLTPTAYATSYGASTLASYDSSNYAISRNNTIVKFVLLCSLPCHSCNTGQPTQCLSCYTLSQNVTSLIYFVQIAGQNYGQCYSSCPSTYYLNATNNSCIKCNSNCQECSMLSTNCTSCPANFSLNPSTLSCVSTCPTGTYSYYSVCTICITGCQSCTSQTICLSCSTGYYLYNSVCSSACPANYTISNALTNRCDACSAACTTCATTTAYCTSCSV